MASSDDEGGVLPHSVSVYEFVGKDEPISFAELPVQWNKGETPDGEHKKIFLRGSIDKGLQKIYWEVIAWKFDLSSEKPEILVLTKENHWIRLLNPRKAFENIIRTILITVHCLHFVKRNPGKSHKALWDHLGKVFRLFDRRPSENDLVDHFSLIDEAVKRDPTLAESKVLVSFLEEKPSKRKAFSKDMRTTSKSNFIVEDDDIIGENEDDISDEEEDNCFDTVCAICDNGGDILCCEGKCMRSFHSNTKAGEDSQCASLGYTRAELADLENIDFYCKNCKYNQHQCFVCGELGSSDESRGAEVFRCVNGACGHFYHPGCVAKLIHKGNDAAAEELQRKIAAGEQFACPLHKCHVCEELEVRKDPELQFAVCRRCPKAYHRKCLPREIADNDVIQRAWEELLPNRLLIYCLEHDIDGDLLTPVRDHIKFPGFEKNNKKQRPLEAQDKQQPLEASDKKEGLVKQRNSASEDVAAKKSSAKPIKRVEKQVYHSQKRGGTLSGQLSFKRQKVVSSQEKPKESNITTEGRMSLGDQLYAAWHGTDLDSIKSKQVERADGEQGPSQKDKPKGTSIMLNLESDAKERILDIMKNASSSVTLEKVVAKHKAPSTYVQSSKYVVDKNVTSGRVEGALAAIRTALVKLDSGSITDAKSVCGTDLLYQVIKWKNKLKVYLAPFIHGLRYTSFGRHFTKVDKFKEIVHILHWYVKDGDMIVDFSCGSNDFSCLMKKKLDEMGKSCSYKNYDIMQAKDDFCFEKRDFMEVQSKELPSGSKLIMGLNPPFGTNGNLANLFIKKALEFRPKLIILIVPKETRRLDEKDSYDLIWEDDEMLAGKSFYLPGSIDVNDKQMEDWNKYPPLLWLWSRPDWTRKHKDIAIQVGHLSKDQNTPSLQKHLTEVLGSSGQLNNLVELPVHQGDDKNVGDRQEHRVPQETRSTTSQKEELPHDDQNNRQEHREPETKVATSHKKESPRDDRNNKQEKNATSSHKKESPHDDRNDKEETRVTSSQKKQSPYDDRNNKQEIMATSSHRKESPHDDLKESPHDDRSKRQETRATSSHKKESPHDDRNNKQETRATSSHKKESPHDDRNDKEETRVTSSQKKQSPHDDRNNKQEIRATSSHKKESPHDDRKESPHDDRSKRQETRATSSHKKESPHDDRNNKQETRATSSHKKESPRESSGTARDRNHGAQKTQSKANSDDISYRSANKRKQATSPDNKSAGKHSLSSQPRCNVDAGGHSRKSLERFPVEKESSSRPYKQARHSGNVDETLLAKYTVPNRRSHTPNREYNRYTTPDQSMGYPRGTTDTHSYRLHEMERRDVQHSWAHGYASNLGPPYPPYGPPPVSLGFSPYGGMTTSAMQRYAPQLDELNPRMNYVGSRPPLPDPSSVYRYPIPRGFAPSRYHLYPQPNSNGWLNEYE